MKIEFQINTEYIELIKLLKATQIVESGAMAKIVVEDRLVYRNGELETRKRAKITVGEVITIGDNEIVVVAE